MTVEIVARATGPNQSAGPGGLRSSRQRNTGQGKTAGAPPIRIASARCGAGADAASVVSYFSMSLENAPKLHRVRALPPTTIGSPSATV